MSPSSGKASGKTPRPPKDVMTALFFGEAVFSPSAQNALANYIAELEAELASERTLAEMAWRANADLVAANEKAEAEVERLTNSLFEQAGKHLEDANIWASRIASSIAERDYWHHAYDTDCEMDGRRGGGRESGEVVHQTGSGHERSPAAANPAARKATPRTAVPYCRDCGETLDPWGRGGHVCAPSIARKERDHAD